jgi:hypothetical protein
MKKTNPKEKIFSGGQRMSALQEIAYYLNIRDEVPNQQLAKKLVEQEDSDGIAEIAAHLADKNASVASDCVKVMYEIGYLDPELIAPYTQSFVNLLNSKNNRMVWGAMIGLSTVADLAADVLAPQISTLLQVMEKGSVITVVSGVKVLGKLVGAAPQLEGQVMPYLTQLLTTCIPRDVPTHAESLLPMMNEHNRGVFQKICESRVADMSTTQARRMRSVMKKMAG